MDKQLENDFLHNNPPSQVECVHENPAMITVLFSSGNDEDSGHIRTIATENGEVDIFLSNSPYGNYSVMLQAEDVVQLTDNQIVRLVRDGAKVGIIQKHINALRFITENKDKILGLYTIDHLKEEFYPSYRILKKINDSLVKFDDYEDNHITQLLVDVECIFAGKFRSSGYVYCLTDQLGHYKIGMSRHVDSRIKQLATQPPFEIKLVASHLVYDMRQYESCLHWLFREKRLRGEWFTLSGEDVESFVNATWPSRYIGSRYTIHGGL